MKFVQLRLAHIRSYTSLDVSFPSGVVLFSGAIGSGKTTLFLSIEFALFGLQRGEVSGDMLLRQGSSSGSVELHLLINGNDVVIKRSLKRSSSGVTCDMCYLEVDGKASFYSIGEINSRILTLLGYPQSLVTKKSLFYRFTVYTPQEEMKRILQASTLERLDTLRKVFDVEKYKIVQENTVLLIKELQMQSRDLSVRLERRVPLEKRLEELRVAYDTIHLEPYEKDVAQLHEVVDLLREKVASVRLLHERRESLKKNISLLREHIVSHTVLSERSERKLSALREEIASFLLEPVLFFAEDFFAVEDVLRRAESEKIVLYRALSSLLSEKVSYEKQVATLVGLAVCPTCHHEVSPEHVRTAYGTLLHNLRQKEESLLSEQESVDALVHETYHLLQDLRSRHDAYRDYVEKKRSYDRCVLLEKEEQEQLIVLQDQLVALQQSFNEYEKELTVFVVPQDDCVYELATHERLLREAQATLTSLRERLTFLFEQQQEVQDALDVLAGVAADLEKKQASVTWLHHVFRPLLSRIEASVLHALRREFHMLFSQWFSLLLDSDALHVSFDAFFTPQILLQGHAVTYDHLSGGERSAIALAYRLALNEMLLSVVDHWHSSGVIILDEPTDGFSDEQIDTMRSVLEKLSVEQILLVSHERKMESFADHVITVVKQNGVSTLVDIRFK